MTTPDDTETHAVMDASDNAECVDDCPGCKAAVPPPGVRDKDFSVFDRFTVNWTVPPDDFAIHGEMEPRPPHVKRGDTQGYGLSDHQEGEE
jgi:hypothetical protein